ncbi:hypothetical protein D3C76_1317970 [compost metagenome]
MSRARASRRLSLFQPGGADEDRRGDRWPQERTLGRGDLAGTRRALRSYRRARPGHPGLHRQPWRSWLWHRGHARAQRVGDRPADPGSHPARAGRFSHGAVRAVRSHRAGRFAPGYRIDLRAVLPGAALSADGDHSPTSGGRVARAQGGARLLPLRRGRATGTRGGTGTQREAADSVGQRCAAPRP